MKITLDELTKGISKFLGYFIFERLDSTTMECIEQQIGNCLESKNVGLEFSDYNIRSTILDKTTLKVNVQFDDNNLDFYLGAA